MEFGITFKGFVEPERARKLVAQAEEAGLHIVFTIVISFGERVSCNGYAWSIKNMRFGPCVTNQYS